MGEVILKGKDALNYIQMLVTNDCSQMKDGQVRYSPMCNDEGGVIDDLLIYRINEEEYLIMSMHLTARRIWTGLKSIYPEI